MKFKNKEDQSMMKEVKIGISHLSETEKEGAQRSLLEY